jgi:hypothetical protein
MILLSKRTEKLHVYLIILTNESVRKPFLLYSFILPVPSSMHCRDLLIPQSSLCALYQVSAFLGTLKTPLSGQQIEFKPQHQWGVKREFKMTKCSNQIMHFLTHQPFHQTSLSSPHIY